MTSFTLYSVCMTYLNRYEFISYELSTFIVYHRYMRAVKPCISSLIWRRRTSASPQILSEKTNLRTSIWTEDSSIFLYYELQIFSQSCYGCKMVRIVSRAKENNLLLALVLLYWLFTDNLVTHCTHSTYIYT